MSTNAANTRERILESAQSLFAQKGYDRSSAAEIASRAGVSQGIIFHHFKTKENLLYQVSIRIMGHLLADLQSEMIKPLNGMEAMRQFLDHYLRFVTEHEEKYRALLRTTPIQNLESDTKSRNAVAANFDQVIGLIEQCLRRGVEDGSIRPLDTETHAYVIFEMLVGYGRIRLMVFRDMPELLEPSIEFCLHSLKP